jgi:hypothetical protein
MSSPTHIRIEPSRLLAILIVTTIFACLACGSLQVTQQIEFSSADEVNP